MTPGKTKATEANQADGVKAPHEYLRQAVNEPAKPMQNHRHTTG